MLSGRRLNLIEPSPLDIEIEDIASVWRATPAGTARPMAAWMEHRPASDLVVESRNGCIRARRHVCSWRPNFMTLQSM